MRSWCFVMTPTDIHKIFIPPKIFIFLKTKGIEIQNFEPSNGPRMNENIIVPPHLHPHLADRNRGRGRPDSNNRKNSDKGVFFCFFFATIFFYGSKGSKHLSGGGGGCNFLLFYLFIYLFYLFYFFFGGGGGLGRGANPYFYRNLYNL